MTRFKLKPTAIAAVAALALLAGYLVFFGNKPKTPNPAMGAPVASASGATRAPSANRAKPALTVTTTQPQRLTLPIQLNANGTVAAWQEAVVGSESHGLRLAEVRVNVGDVVKAGQVLARFADEGVQADVAQARAGVAQASAQADEATANADRVRTLQGTGTFSGQQINQYLTAEQAARARVESAKAALTSQQLRLKYTQVTAPDAGVISARSATVGAVVANGAELFRLIRQGRLEWRAEVTSAELGRVKVGALVNVTAASGVPLKGRVRMVAPTVDAQTRTGLVYVDLLALPAGQTGAAKAGMFAQGEFVLGSSEALTVPQQAVVVRDGFSYAFRLNPDQRVSQIKLQVGRRLGDRVEVLEGASLETVLVASGAGFLNDGDLVQVGTPDKAAEKPPVQPAARPMPATQ